MDLSEFRVVDKYTTKVLPVRDTEGLRTWLLHNTKTHTEQFLQLCDRLVESLEEGGEHRWTAEALMLSITAKKRRGRKK